MKNVLIAGLLFLTSCVETVNYSLNLKSPIIVVAKHLPDAATLGSVVLKDGDGVYWSGSTYDSVQGLAQAHPEPE